MENQKKQHRLGDLLIEGIEEAKRFKKCNKWVSIDPKSVDDDVYKVENFSDEKCKEFYESALDGARSCYDNCRKEDSETYMSIADYIHNIRASAHKKD